MRSERNKAREEVRILRGRLEVSQRETSALRREKNDLESQIGHLAQSNHHSRPRKDPPDKPDDGKDQVSFMQLYDTTGIPQYITRLKGLE